MYRVQISARIIHWPNLCACCCRPANTSAEVSSTRVTGKKVIHKHTKSWDVPYCGRCLAHVQAGQTLKKFSIFVIHLSHVIALVGGGVALAALGTLGQQQPAVALGVVLFVAALTAAIILLTFPWCRAKYRREVQAKQAERARLEQHLKALLAPSCAEEDRLAAHYEGWHGSVHTFSLASKQFATAFERSNPGKCLRGGQIHH